MDADDGLQRIFYTLAIRTSIQVVEKCFPSGHRLRQNSTLCYLYGRLLLIVLAYALCPALRTTLWTRRQRELSFRKLIRYLQVLADRWLQTLFESPSLLRHWLVQVCVRAQRVIANASRHHRTSTQQLRNSLEIQTDGIESTIKLVG